MRTDQKGSKKEGRKGIEGKGREGKGSIILCSQIKTRDFGSIKGANDESSVYILMETILSLPSPKVPVCFPMSSRRQLTSQVITLPLNVPQSGG